MAEEAVVEEVIVPSEDSTTEQEQAGTEGAAASEEAVDESGVPLKNRAAEAQRKARQAAKAEKELLTPPKGEEQDPNEALRLIERIADEKIMKRMEPILAKQFLMENPEAADMVEDINRIREQYPELAGVDKLDVAYKVARAERQDELIRQKVEAEAKEREETITKATQASAEGTGRAKAPADTLQQRISSAGSLKELQELEAMLTR